MLYLLGVVDSLRLGARASLATALLSVGVSFRRRLTLS